MMLVRNKAAPVLRFQKIHLYLHRGQHITEMIVEDLGFILWLLLGPEINKASATVFSQTLAVRFVISEKSTLRNSTVTRIIESGLVWNYC